VKTPNWRTAIDSGILDLIREGRESEARELLRFVFCDCRRTSTTGLHPSRCVSASRFLASRQIKAIHDLALAGNTSPRVVAALDVQTASRSTARCTKFPRSGVRHPRVPCPSRRRRKPEDFAEHLYTYYDDGAVGAPSSALTAGLDSMIIGEGEILGQVA